MCGVRADLFAVTRAAHHAPAVGYGKLTGMASTVEELLDKFLYESQSTAEQSSKLERLTEAFLLNDVKWSQRFDAVWGVDGCA